jgi:hypothetical protein
MFELWRAFDFFVFILFYFYFYFIICFIFLTFQSQFDLGRNKSTEPNTVSTLSSFSEEQPLHTYKYIKNKQINKNICRAFVRLLRQVLP